MTRTLKLPLDEKVAWIYGARVPGIVSEFRGYFYVAPIVKAYAPSVAKGRRQDVTANPADEAAPADARLSILKQLLS